MTALSGSHKCSVWLETALDIDYAIDPKDRDYMQIHPGPVVNHFIEAMDELGFAFAKADVEQGQLRGDGFSSRSGIYQELEFKPRGFATLRIEEVELSFIVEPEQTHVLVEVDRRLRGDGYQSLTLPNTISAEEVLDGLGELIG